jgi:hypothetical protein
VADINCTPKWFIMPWRARLPATRSWGVGGETAEELARLTSHPMAENKPRL